MSFKRGSTSCQQSHPAALYSITSYKIERGSGPEAWDRTGYHTKELSTVR